MHLNKNTSTDNVIYKVITLLPFILFTSGAWAATTICTVNTSSVTVNAGTFTVQRDAAIGSAISGEISGANNKIITCTTNTQNQLGGLGIRAVTAATTPTYNGYGVFSTNLAGVGSLIGCNATLVNPQGNTKTETSFLAPGETEQKLYGVASNKAQQFTISVQNLFQLIKTSSTISSGPVNLKIAELYATGTANFTAIPVYLTATVNALKCSVNASNISVTLPTVAAGSFTGTGQTQGSTAFTVGLQCDASARINATMNFTQDSDSTDQSVIAVNNKGSAGVASGVGIQLLYNGTPLKNNTLTFLKTSSGGQEFPSGAFTARYFQTKSTVLPGTANATATMTLTYQ